MASHFGRSQDRLLPVLAILLVLTLAGSAFAANGRVLANSTPRFVQNAQNLGPEDPSKVVSITVRLQLHNLAGRDALLKQTLHPGFARLSPVAHARAVRRPLCPDGTGSGLGAGFPQVSRFNGHRGSR